MLWLQAVLLGHPPQSVLQTQAHALGSAWYVGPQLSAAVSQTQPQLAASKRWPAGQVAVCGQEQVQLAVSQTSSPPQVPLQSALHVCPATQ